MQVMEFVRTGLVKRKGCPLQMLRRKCNLGVLASSVVIQDSKTLDLPSSRPSSSVSLPPYPPDLFCSRVGPTAKLCFVLCNLPLLYRWLLHKCYLQITGDMK